MVLPNLQYPCLMRNTLNLNPNLKSKRFHYLLLKPSQFLCLYIVRTVLNLNGKLDRTLFTPIIFQFQRLSVWQLLPFGLSRTFTDYFAAIFIITQIVDESSFTVIKSPVHYNVLKLVVFLIIKIVLYFHDLTLGL